MPLKIVLLFVAVLSMGVCSVGAGAQTSSEGDAAVSLEVKETAKKKRKIQKVVCGSYGCDDLLQRRCPGENYRIIQQRTQNKYSSRKNQVTGGFDSSRKETVVIYFKCTEAKKMVVEP